MCKNEPQYFKCEQCGLAHAVLTKSLVWPCNQCKEILSADPDGVPDEMLSILVIEAEGTLEEIFGVMVMESRKAVPNARCKGGRMVIAVRTDADPMIAMCVVYNELTTDLEYRPLDFTAWTEPGDYVHEVDLTAQPARVLHELNLIEADFKRSVNIVNIKDTTREIIVEKILTFIKKRDGGTL